ncbi:MAG: hypothetical protein ACJ8E3_06395 [Sphingomicrobium sp.]
MMVQEDLVRAGAGAPGIEAIDEPAIALRDRPCDELRAIASRGIHGGDLYFEAAAELERRARNLEAAESAERAKTVALRRQQMFLLAILAGACCAALYARLFGL